MTTWEIEQFFKKELQKQYPPEEIEAFIYLIFEELMAYSRVNFHFNRNKEVPEHIFKQLIKYIYRLKKNEPLQYIMGYTEFYGLRFNVNPAVLIPRQETEELVDWIITDAQKTNKPLKILDIGTGSGAIAIALKKTIKNANVQAIDFSAQALEVATQNALLNNVTINFERINILNDPFLFDNFDIVVSNPPYIRQCEKKRMHKNILDYEPGIALFVENENPFIFYEQIIKIAQKSLKKNAYIYFEINEYLPKELIKLIKSYNFKNLLIRKDINEKYRMIKIENS